MHGPMSQQSRQRILLIEDNSLDATMFKLALSRIAKNVDLTVITNVKQAVETISLDIRIADLILIDLSLEDGTGFDVLRAIRSSPQNHLIPSIVLSGSDRQDDITLAYAYGANAYVCKPMDLPEWVNMVESIHDYWFNCARIP